MILGLAGFGDSLPLLVSWIDSSGIMGTGVEENYGTRGGRLDGYSGSKY
jgi:hypothetical protein